MVFSLESVEDAVAFAWKSSYVDVDPKWRRRTEKKQRKEKM